ncbi:uncharacterized protein DS421_14g463990 [Arachis hypogaea]|nr:uncharacterized protein DS421_14g463990 [Arachis hypogaea]
MARGTTSKIARGMASWLTTNLVAILSVKGGDSEIDGSVMEVRVFCTFQGKATQNPFKAASRKTTTTDGDGDGKLKENHRNE